MYYEECWKIKTEKNKKSCQKHRLAKKVKLKHEKQKILEVVDKGKLWGLNLMARQYQVITLGLPFMSQLVSVRGAFHKKWEMLGGIVIGLALKRPRPMILQLPGILVQETKVYDIIAPLAQDEDGKKDLRVF